jgi:hypothetical protein
MNPRPSTMTPVPMPLTLARWLSSLENGQRLVEADFFSLEMLTTLGWAFRTASETGVLREATSAVAPGIGPISVAPKRAAMSQSRSCRILGSGTLEPPKAESGQRHGPSHGEPIPPRAALPDRILEETR